MNKDLSIIPNGQTGIQKNYMESIELVNDIILKKQVENLSLFPVESFNECFMKSDTYDGIDFNRMMNDIDYYKEKVMLFKINQMVYTDNEFSLFKLASAFNSVNSKCNVFMVINSDGRETNFYLGVSTTIPEVDRKSQKACNILERSLRGQFPGVIVKIDKDLEKLRDEIKNARTVASVTTIANFKDDKKEEKSFAQGLEKFVNAMQGEKYTGVIIAEKLTNADICDYRTNYESIYTNLAPFSEYQYSDNYSNSVTSNPVSMSVGVVSKSLGKSKSDTHTQINSYSLKNKNITEMLDKIDKQIKRINEAESVGAWQCAAYFLTKSNDGAIAAASSYNSIMRGQESNIESAGVNQWHKSDIGNFEEILKYLCCYANPNFIYSDDIKLQATSFITSNELAIMMGLPRHSVCGFPVIEHSEFGKEVTKYDNDCDDEGIMIGRIFNMGKATKQRVNLNVESLSMHTLITGSTGSGKSNTVYQILKTLKQKGIKFLVVEPAKGEYKSVVWDGNHDVSVYGSNRNFTPLLRINPFSFPEKIHIFEHVDRLVEIFNVCWPMYAAMPAVLKEAILRAYERCGWDLINSTNSFEERLFPAFSDVCSTIREVIDESEYSSDNKSNYVGSLETRLRSLTNGLNGQMFTADEISNEKLFDENVIVDLSRIGSLETKSLIMGILIMKLNEYRMSNATGSNELLKHVTVLEEAHNILKRTSNNQSAEGSNVAGKSVEMISNSIAEIRTYGEGFIIVDQSPEAVDSSAIRNTNTKIIMRLPNESDRKLVGKAAGLKDNQIDEISKLQKGVAVIYQNDWVESVLCKIEKADIIEEPFKPIAEDIPVIDLKRFVTEYIKLLLTPLVKGIEPDTDYIEKELIRSRLETADIIFARKLIAQYKCANITFDISDVYDRVTKLFFTPSSLKKLINNSKLNELNYEFKNALGEKANDEVFNAYQKLRIYQCFMRTYAINNKDKIDFCLKWKEMSVKGGI